MMTVDMAFRVLRLTMIGIAAADGKKLSWSSRGFLRARRLFFISSSSGISVSKFYSFGPHDVYDEVVNGKIPQAKLVPSLPVHPSQCKMWRPLFILFTCYALAQFTCLDFLFYWYLWLTLTPSDVLRTRSISPWFTPQIRI
jgi:hypothetical protein